VVSFMAADTAEGSTRPDESIGSRVTSAPAASSALLYGCRDQVVARPAAAPEHTPQGSIVRFRTSRCKDYFAGIGADQSCNRAPGIFHGRPRLLPESVNRACIPEVFPEKRKHGLEDGLINAGGCAVVEIDTRLHCSRPLAKPHKNLRVGIETIDRESGGSPGLRASYGRQPHRTTYRRAQSKSRRNRERGKYLLLRGRGCSALNGSEPRAGALPKM
jgi:hypothetical protein